MKGWSGFKINSDQEQGSQTLPDWMRQQASIPGSQGDEAEDAGQNYAGQNYDEQNEGAYDNDGFRKGCKKMSAEVLERIENYMKRDYKILGILGVEFSKTCGIHQVRNGRRSSPGKGIFMEELEQEMQKKNFQVPMIGVNLNNVYSSIDKIQSLLKFT